MSWSQDMIDTLIKLHGEGQSAGVIGQRIRMTRNAVVGKIYRLRKCGILKDEACVQRRRFGSKGGYAPRIPKQRKARERAGFHLVPRGPALRATPVPLPREEDIARVSFAELGHGHCRFICCAEPAEAVAAGAKLYCGLPRIAGTSWCEGHLARVAPHSVIERLVPAVEPALEQEELAHA